MTGTILLYYVVEKLLGHAFFDRIGILYNSVQCLVLQLQVLSSEFSHSRMLSFSFASSSRAVRVGRSTILLVQDRREGTNRRPVLNLCRAILKKCKRRFPPAPSGKRGTRGTIFRVIWVI